MKRPVAAVGEPTADTIDDEFDLNGSGSALRGVCNLALRDAGHDRWSTNTKTVGRATTGGRSAARGCAAPLGGTGRPAPDWASVLNPRCTAGAPHYLAGNRPKSAWARTLAAGSAPDGRRTGRHNAARNAWAAVNVTGPDTAR